MPETSLIYRGAIRVARAFLPLAALLNAKLRKAHVARAGVLDRGRAGGAAHRDTSRPLVWFHAPSVGEGLQAESVIEVARAAHPDWQVAYTHFSSSAEGLARRIRADFADYLPYDTRGDVDAILDALAPTALVFTKLDLWPELATRAAARGVKVVLIAATVRPGSGRLGWPTRDLLAPGYAALDAAAAIDPADAVRLSALGALPDRITIEGDPRFDSASAKVAAVSASDPLLAWWRDAPTLVAGSTWEMDEELLLKAFIRVRREHPTARLILVPHEPSAGHLSALEAKAAALRVPVQPVRHSAAEGPVDLLLVDRVGVLAALYGAGQIAYVGGGYRRAGLHSVLEPAAWGIPVLMGPRWTESRDAGLLRTAGAAVGLPEVGGAEDPVELLYRTWSGWISDAAARSKAGAAARATVDAGLGASARSVAVIARSIGRR